MKLGAALTLMGLGLGGLVFVVSQGCGGDSENEEGGGASGAQPPASEGSPTTATDERTFAVDSLSLGETNRGGTKDTNAWKTYGYNLDKQITTKADVSKVCKKVTGAQASNADDGDQGIDNAFGHVILPLIENALPGPSKTISDQIKSGAFTIMMKIKGLTDDPAQSNTGLSGTILVGAGFGEGKKPTFTKSDDWPYFSSPQVPINGAYITKGTFVNGEPQTISLSLAIGGQTLTLTVQKAIITFKHDGANITDGTIAGVIKTQEFVDGLSKVAGSFDKSFCSGSTIEGLKNSVKQASDILQDGTQDPTKECDGISVGIGFTAKEVGNPTQSQAQTGIENDPCTTPAGDGGT